MKLPSALRQLRPRNIFIAIAIGLGVAGYLVYKDYDHQSFDQINWGFQTFLWLTIALVMMAIRDLGYMIRIRVLTDNQLSWKQSFNVIMLWEFASALTPSVVGGSGIAMFILNREKIALGRSTAIVLVTALLDELFYILMVPICILLVGFNDIFPHFEGNVLEGLSLGLKGVFYLGYSFIVLLTSIILLSVFFFPQGFKTVLVKLFSLPILRRWRSRAATVGDEVIITSRELKEKKFGFWAKSFGATFFSWMARFLVINCLAMAFMSITMADHALIFGRQMVMWVIMLISPTPGGSGVAEFIFAGFLKEFFPPNLDGFQAFLWRFLSYYPYLIIGTILLPRWWAKTAIHKDPVSKELLAEAE